MTKHPESLMCVILVMYGGKGGDSSKEGDRRWRFLVVMVGGNIERESRWENLEWWFV